MTKLAMRNHLWSLAPLGAAAAVLLAGCSAGQTSARQTSAAEVRAIPVQVVTVEERQITEELLLTGTLKPQAQVQIVSEVSARLMRLLKDEGAAVAKGEVIALLDSTDARLVHERATAVVAVADANREHAAAERDRANNLLKTGGITDKDHLAAMVNLQVAEAALRQAKAEEAIAAQQLVRCQMHAPFSGTIAKRFADPGTMLAVGAPVVNLVDNSMLEFRAAAPSADLSKVKLGASAQITVDALPGMALNGTIARILPTADERSRSFEVIVRVPGRAELISGLFARGRIRVREVAGAIVVPPSALVHDGSRPGFASIFVVENGKANLREMSVGVETAEAVQVSGDVRAGATVVVDPPPTLASGAPVQTRSRAVSR